MQNTCIIKKKIFVLIAILVLITPPTTHAILGKGNSTVPTREDPLEKNEEITVIEKFYAEYERKVFKQFGYHIFESNTPLANKIVGPDYVVGPKDVINVKLWGESLQEIDNSSSKKDYGNVIKHKLIVNEDGVIIFPEIGVISVNGITLSELKKIVTHKYKDYCKNCKTIISIDNPKKFQTLITGAIKTPGYTDAISGSSVYDILYKARGITRQGSLRNIKLMHSDGTSEIIDLYHFILTGEFKKLPIIRFNDSVHINPTGSVVLLKGQIRQPGIFEFKENESLNDIILFAGGMLPDTDKSHIEITRFGETGRQIISLPDNKGKMTLKDGDSVNFLKQDIEIKNAIRLKGHVIAPKSFSWRKDFYLKDIISDTSLFKPKASLDYAEIRRYGKSNKNPTILIFHPENLINNAIEDSKNTRVKLQPFDEVIIFSQRSLQEKPMVSINGAVKKAGKYPWVENMTVQNLLNKAGGARWSACDTVRIARYSYKDKKWVTSMLERSLSELKNNVSEDTKLKPHDRVSINEQRDYHQTTWKINIAGEVNYPGEYPIGTKTHLSDIMKQAGLLTDNADLARLVFVRRYAKNIQTEHQKMAVELLKKDLIKKASQNTISYLNEDERLEKKQSIAILQNYMAHLKSKKTSGRLVLNENNLISFEALTGSISDIILQNGDNILIPEKVNFVSVVGEVFSPASYLYKEGGKVSDYLHQAGGVSQYTDLTSAFITRSNGSVTSYAQKGKRFTDVVMKPGDVLILPSEVLRQSK